MLEKIRRKNIWLVMLIFTKQKDGDCNVIVRILLAAKYISLVVFFFLQQMYLQRGDMSFHFDIRLYWNAPFLLLKAVASSRLVRGSTTKTLQNRQCSSSGKVPSGCKH